MLKKVPGAMVIVFYMVVVAAILTWIIPSGEYVRERVLVGGVEKEIVQEASFHYVESQPQFFSIFFALFRGFVDKADIVVFVLMVGGAFWILNSTGAIDKGVNCFVRRLRKKENKQNKIRWLTADDMVFALIMLLFSLFGAVFGMSEETLAFILIFVPMAISMGYDSIVGICICYLAAHVGFAGAMLNPFTVGIAQGIAGLPLFSGVEYRFFCWLILTLSAIVIVLGYAHKVKRNPSYSPMYALDEFWRKGKKETDNGGREQKDELGRNPSKFNFFVRCGLFLFLLGLQCYISYLYPMSALNIGGLEAVFPILPIVTLLFALVGLYTVWRSEAAFLINLFLFTIVYLVVGVLVFQWYIMEIAGLFFGMGVAVGLSSGQGIPSLMKQFMEGVKDMLGPAMVIGMASGIIFILQEGKVIDTILYSVSTGMCQVGEVSSLAGMYLFETALNIVMPSGSAKAALTMPILAPLSDLLHISRQTSVLAFQFGDGFTNMITPTSGILMGVLGVARIPYGVWLKWVYKKILFWIGVGFILLLPTLYISFNGF